MWPDQSAFCDNDTLVGNASNVTGPLSVIARLVGNTKDLQLSSVASIEELGSLVYAKVSSFRCGEGLTLQLHTLISIWGIVATADTTSRKSPAKIRKPRIIADLKYGRSDE